MNRQDHISREVETNETVFQDFSELQVLTQELGRHNRSDPSNNLRVLEFGMGSVRPTLDSKIFPEDH